MDTLLISGFYSDMQTDLIINSLGQNKKIKIDTWITKYNNFNYINKNIIIDEILDNHDCIRGINFSKKLNNIKKFSKLIKFSRNYAQIFIEMMTRFDPNIRYDDNYRLNHFHFLLRNWASYINNRKINKVLFMYTPHTLYDYAIYVVCKYLGIKIVIFEDTKYFASGFFINSIENLSKLGKNYKKKNSKKISVKTKTFIESNKLLSTKKYNGNIEAFSEIPFKHQVSYIKIFYWTFISPFLKYKLNFFEIYRYFFTKQNRAIWNYSKFKYNSKDSMPSLFHDQFYYFKKNYHIKKLKKSYDALSVLPECKNDYVVFYDSINPEKSVIPDASSFPSTLKILKEIRKYIPKKWQIYYKEHPAAYSLHYETHLTKKMSFYNELIKIPNLKLINLSVDKKKLLINSKFTITRTGEIAFQSVVNGVPALNLGNAWYSSYEEVVHIKKFTEISKGVKLILNSENAGISKIKAFLNTVEKQSFDINYKGVNINWIEYNQIKNNRKFDKKFKIIINNFRKNFIDFK